MTFMTEDIVEVDPKTETISCDGGEDGLGHPAVCLLYTSPSPRDLARSRMPSSA